MPSVESNTGAALVSIFDELRGAKSVQAKSNALSRAKEHVLNRMSADELRAFFLHDTSGHLTDLFEQLNVWTRDLDACNGIVEFLEPYDIVERILDLVETFESAFKDVRVYEKLVYMSEQTRDEKVKHELVKRLTQLVSKDKKIEIIGNELETRVKHFLVVQLKQITSTSCNFTKHLAEFLCKLAEKVDDIKRFISDEFRADSRRILDSSDSVMAFRMLEIVMKLACSRARNLTDLVEPEFHLSEKLAEYLRVDNRDVLAKLNCVELLACLVDTPHGLEYVEARGHLTALLGVLTQPGQDPFGVLLVPAIVKLFALIAKKNPTLVDQNYPSYYAYLFTEALNDDFVRNHESINLAIETFSYLFESNSVKRFMHAHYSQRLTTLLTHMTEILRTSINDRLRSHCLTSLAEAFAPDASILSGANTDHRVDEKWSRSEYTQSREWQELAKSMYESASAKLGHEQLFNLCLKMAKQPFVEQRMSAQLYFKALAQTRWGLEKLFEPNKFNSDEAFLTGYLLSRAIELEKEGLESKYELIRLLVASFESQPDLIRLVGGEIFERMKTYVQEGPFLARAQARVAFESN